MILAAVNTDTTVWDFEYLKISCKTLQMCLTTIVHSPSVPSPSISFPWRTLLYTFIWFIVHVNSSLQLFSVKLLTSKLLSRATFHRKSNEKLGSTGNIRKNSQNTHLSICSHKSSFGLFCACERNDSLLAVFLFSSKGGYFFAPLYCVSY